MKNIKEKISDRGFSSDPIYLTDLTLCQPSQALSPEPKLGHWRTLAYETETLSGVMLMAGNETVAPEVTYPVEAQGLHAVSIGVWGDHVTPGTTRWYGQLRTFVEVLIKTTGDDTSSLLTLPGLEWGFAERLMELYWGVVDLTDRDLVLGQVQWRVAAGDGPGAIQCANARIAYIKLIPLTDSEIDEYQSDKQSPDAKRLFAHNDAGGPMYYRPTTAAEIRSHLEQYRDSDISKLYWEAGMGDSMNYFSEIGRTPTHDRLNDFGRVHTRLNAEGLRILRRKDIDPFKVALKHAHSMGLEFHAGYRVAGFHFPPPHDYENEGATFYKFHPELRGVDRNGNLTPRMSYTYPEVRRFVISLLEEMTRLGVDGVCLLYNRRPPLVEYEPPLIEGFISEYGDDPRKIEEDDPRWLSFRSRVLTKFMHEVRDAMDLATEKLGRTKRLEVSAVVMASPEENLYHAMDLKTWIDEGVIDTLIPYSSFHDLESMSEAWTDVNQVEALLSLTRGTSCTLAPNIMPRQLSPEELRIRANVLYDAGVEHLFFWDSDVLQPRSNSAGSWNAIRRLGHKDEIKAWREAGEPSLNTPTMEITHLGDWDLSYRTPG